MSLPDFLIKRIPKQKNINRIRHLLDDNNLHTVCESASCPNIGECFSCNTLTFMIMGDVCTRNCNFCGVKKGRPEQLDPDEPEKIAGAVKKLGLDYVVITSVTRDDLPDGGANHFAAIIEKLKPIKTEVLIPDFKGSNKALQKVIDAQPFVLNHNLETIAKLYQEVRPMANYQTSLNLLFNAKKQGKLYTKSGIMVGLGEEKEEVIALLADLSSVGCDIVTIGQYLAPGKKNLTVKRYVEPEEYLYYQKKGKELGLKVLAGPFVRSSYQAKNIINDESC